MNERVAQIVEIQNRVTQMEVDNKQAENKLKQEISKLRHSNEIYYYQIKSLEKEVNDLRNTENVMNEGIDQLKQDLDNAKMFTVELNNKARDVLNVEVVNLRREINEINSFTQKENVSITHLSDLYRKNFTKYDLILSDINFKTDKVVKTTDNFVSKKIDSQEVRPKLAKLQREINNLRLKLSKIPEAADQQTNAEPAKRHTDIYLQTEKCASEANDNLKLFVKISTLTAKTIATQEHLAILQEFIEGKIKAFEEQELACTEETAKMFEK